SSLAIGCGDDGDDDGSVVDPTDSAEIRVIHASPDAPAVDIYAEGIDTPLIQNLAYGDASDYLEVDAGTYNFQIRAAGAEAGSDPAYSTGNLELAADSKISALAVGLLGSTDEVDSFRVLPLAEGFAAPDSGNAIVRIVHASADAPTVALDVGNDGTPEVEDFARFADTGAEGVALPAGEALQIGVWAGDPLARVTAFTTPELPDGAELIVIATGLLSSQARQDDGFSLLAIGPTGAIGFIKQNPVVYALHASPDAPAVDIYVGEDPLVQEIAFGALSAPIQVPPSRYTLDFYAAGTGPGTPAASDETPDLAAGEKYLAIATGFLGVGENAFQLLPLGDALDLDDPENARVQVVHASPDAPGVDVSPLDGGQLAQPPAVGNLVFADSTEGAGLSLPPGTLTLGVAGAGSLDPLVSFDVPLAGGLRAFAVAAGALSPEAGQEGFRLLIVDTTA
ncbi:MAG: DUF4397 domain-containing protein, partial [Myxococcota bacterium]